jgi:RNA polymerase sigma-70 factor (family 1)
LLYVWVTIVNIKGLSQDKLYNEQELLTRIAEGDEVAFSLLYHHYYPKIYALARHFTESPVFAEEIVQDVFLKVWLKQQSLHEIVDFDSYLFVMARNQIYMYLKKMANSKTQPAELISFDPADAHTPERRLQSKEYALLLAQAVNRLPRQQSDVYRLSKEEGLTREQIAAHLNISPETVKVHLTRAMRSIRTFLLAKLMMILL